MSSKTKRWIFVLSTFLFVVGLLAILNVPVSASAVQVTGVTSNSCFTCHEDLYYLHDTGKYYCITDHKDRCMNCHEGNASVLNKDQSHLGLVVHPQGNDGAKCQECHADDAQARIDTFASESGGFATVIKAETYAPSKEVVSGFPSMQEESRFVKSWGWVVGGIFLFGFWLALVLLSPQKP
jgi:hypothetical protein